ncbi:hypothetical protein [Komagataeibacter swingsii]|uniref:Uncharacterized protein n=1 Tax=Komagataeibacter swingsii TaxID=215220 RepID=A0A850P4K8_9PROT|nr:hypothetical protein [Komagataeibacter swingsii]NVN38013.1 hypothetical protein [Komagataeibacter swingsii]
MSYPAGMTESDPVLRASMGRVKRALLVSGSRCSGKDRGSLPYGATGTTNR